MTWQLPEHTVLGLFTTSTASELLKKIDVTRTLKILKSLSIPRQFRDDYQTWQIRGVSKIFHPNKKFLQAYVLDLKKSQKS